MSASTATHAPDALLLGFTEALRAAGVGVTPDRATAYLEAASRLGAGDREHVRRAGRATLCAGPDDLARHDQVFESWYTTHPETPRHPPRPAPARPVRAPLPLDDGGAPDGEQQEDTELVRAAASDVEVLARRDVAAMSSAEKALLDALIASLRPRLPQRRATRREAWRRGEVDVHRTLRSSLRRLGEPSRVEHRRRRRTTRRLVLLVDVSGSMKAYADALLRLAHALVAAGAGERRGVEVFTLGTRLTRVTDALRTADPERALVRAGEQVPDWSGGTRLGETLGAFLDRWGSRGLARGAVVVVFSDGWERGGAEELGRQMERLQRLARRVVWVNPHRGKIGYEPVQLGIAAALPHCDDFVAGHSLRTFEELVEVIARA